LRDRTAQSSVTTIVLGGEAESKSPPCRSKSASDKGGIPKVNFAVAAFLTVVHPTVQAVHCYEAAMLDLGEHIQLTN